MTRERFAATEALSIAYEVMEQVRKLTAQDMLTNGDQFAHGRIVSILDIKDEVFNDAQSRLAELRDSMENVKCAHCEDPESHDPDPGLWQGCRYTDCTLPALFGEDICSKHLTLEANAAALADEFPDWDELDERRREQVRINTLREAAGRAQDLTLDAGQFGEVIASPASIMAANYNPRMENNYHASTHWKTEATCAVAGCKLADLAALDPDLRADEFQRKTAQDVFSNIAKAFEPRAPEGPGYRALQDGQPLKWTGDPWRKHRGPGNQRRRREQRFMTWLREDRGAKHYHTDIGLPEGFDIERYMRNLPDELAGGPHYEERRETKRLPRSVTREWVKEARLIDIAMKDRRLLRFAVRAPWTSTHDLTVAIDPTTGKLITGWFNRHDDWHRLDGDSVQYERPGTPGRSV